ARLPVRLLVADVEDRRPDHQAEGIEPGLLDEEELGHREVGGEEPALVLLESGHPRLGDPFERGRVVFGHGVLAPSRTMVCGSSRRCSPWGAIAVPRAWMVTITSSRASSCCSPSRIRTRGPPVHPTRPP